MSAPALLGVCTAGSQPDDTSRGPPFSLPCQEDPDFFDDSHHDVGGDESHSASSTPFTPADSTGETSWQLNAAAADEGEEAKKPLKAATVREQGFAGRAQHGQRARHARLNRTLKSAVRALSAPF